MEPRITRQDNSRKFQGNIQLADHNKEMRKKKAKLLAKKSENTSLQSSVVSASIQRKRKCYHRIIELKAKVPKSEVASTKTTVKKNKKNSKAFSKRKTKKGRGRLSALQHPRLCKIKVTDLKDIKPESIKPKKTQTAKVRRQQRTPVKVTTVTDNKRIKRQRSETLDLKQSKTHLKKSNIQNKKLIITKPTNESRSRKLPSNVTQLDELKETTEKTSFIRPYLSFETNLQKFVSNICCVDQNTLWIGRMEYGSIMKVTYNSSNILTIVKELKYPKCDFYDFCYDRNRNQILYTDRRYDSIMSISSKYKLKKFKCVKPLRPTCITISPDDFIFLGLVNAYSYQESAVREIVKLARNGTVIMRIPSIHDNLVRFTLPHRIAIQTNNDIVIIADNDINGGMIICFDSEGQIKFKKSVTSPGVRFQPRGLTISRAGDIITCNQANGEIYIFDVKGQLMERIKSHLIGISDIPWSLALDNCGHLLIGTMVKYEPNVPTIYFAEYLYR